MSWTLKTIFVVAIVFSLNTVNADDIPFDQNLSEPASNDTQNSGPAQDEGATPPELELAPVPMPTVKAKAPSTDAKKKQAPAELAGLGNLSAFEDIAVISKRFLPKTSRFELFPNGGLILNDAFFNDIVLGARLAYYFTEQYGLEVIGENIASSNKQVTNELANERAVGTQALATPSAFYGLDFKWSPIYGKIAWLNKSIIPFDFYFSGGGGITQTNQSTSPPTLHLGAGQLFAIEKWLAFRWDISWYAYQTTTNVVNKPNGTYTNLHATIGVSFFFPGAGYR